MRNLNTKWLICQVALLAHYIMYAQARPLPRRKDFTDTTDTQLF